MTGESSGVLPNARLHAMHIYKSGQPHSGLYGRKIMRGHKGNGIGEKGHRALQEQEGGRACGRKGMQTKSSYVYIGGNHEDMEARAKRGQGIRHYRN